MDIIDPRIIKEDNLKKDRKTIRSAEITKNMLSTKLSLGMINEDEIDEAIDIYLSGTLTDFPDLGYNDYITLEPTLYRRIDKMPSNRFKFGVYRANAENLLVASTLFGFDGKRPKKFRKKSLTLSRYFYFIATNHAARGMIKRFYIDTLDRLCKEFDKWTEVLDNVKIDHTMYGPEINRFKDKDLENQINELYNQLDISFDN